MARGGFKQKRGGGRSFSKHLVLNEEGTAVSVDKWEARGKKKGEEDEDESEEEEESEEEDSEEEEIPAGSSQAQAELTRAQRKEMKKSKKSQGQKGEGEDSDEDQDPILRNPNITAGKKLNISDLSAPRELSRKEKEAKAAKEAKDRYWKLHSEGKTDEAKSDLARLAKIRAERAAAAAKRKAEAEAKAAEIDAKKKEQLGKGKRA